MKNPQKSPPKFFCEYCDYYTSNKKDFNKHLNTPKHKMEILGNINKLIFCPFCNKSYKTNSGLWKHKKKCNKKIKTGFNHRIHPGIIKAKQFIENGAIGNLLNIRARYGHGGRIGMEKEWRSSKDLCGRSW